MGYEESWQYTPPSLLERLKTKFKNKKELLKQKLIRKLGGYTYDEMHREVTRGETGDLKFAWLCRNKPMSSADFKSCEKYVNTHCKYQTHITFENYWGYRGNYPEGDFK